MPNHISHKGANSEMENQVLEVDLLH